MALGISKGHNPVVIHVDATSSPEAVAVANPAETSAAMSLHRAEILRRIADIAKKVPSDSQAKPEAPFLKNIFCTEEIPAKFLP